MSFLHFLLFLNKFTRVIIITVKNYMHIKGGGLWKLLMRHRRPYGVMVNNANHRPRIP
jgi:hypothetical protein